MKPRAAFMILAMALLPLMAEGPSIGWKPDSADILKASTFPPSRAPADALDALSLSTSDGFALTSNVGYSASNTSLSSSWNLYSVTASLTASLGSPISLGNSAVGGRNAASRSWRLDEINLRDAFARFPEPGIYMLLGVGILLCSQRFLRRKSV